MRIIKGSLIVIFFLGIFGILFYHKSIETKLVEWSVQKYSHTYFGSNLSFASVQPKGQNTLVFSDPYIKTKFGEIEGSGLVIKYHLSLKGIELFATLENGVLYFEDAQTPITFYGTSKKKESAIIEMNFSSFPLTTQALKKFTHEWDIEEGTADGNLLFTFTKNSPVECSGALQINQFSLTHLPSQVQIQGDLSHLFCEKRDDRLGTLNIEGLHFFLPEDQEKDFLAETLYQELKNLRLPAHAQLKTSPGGVILEGKILFPEQNFLALDVKFDRSGIEHVWFECKELQLENYPVCSSQCENLLLSSAASFSGELCQGKIKGEVLLRDFVLDNEFFSFSLPHFSIPLRAKSVELTEGTLHLKSQDIDIDQLTGHLVFSPNQLQLIDLKGNSQDIHLAADVTIRHEGTANPFFISIKQKALNGPITRCSTLLKKCGLSLPFSDLPVEGYFSLTEGGMRFPLCRNTSDMQYEMEGVATEMRYTSPSALENHQWAMSHGECRFSYNQQHQFRLDQIRANLFLGENEKIEEFFLSGDGLCSENLSSGKCDFDLWLGNRQRDVIRLAGNTSYLPNGDLSFSFDTEKTHIGSIHPEISLCAFSDLFILKEMNMTARIPLEQNFADVKRCAQIGRLLFPTLPIDFIETWKTASGIIDLSLRWQNGTLTHQMQAKDLKVNQFQADPFCFNGSFRNQQWRLDQLQVGDLHISAQVDCSQKETEDYLIHNLTLAHKDLSLSCQKGTYTPSSSTLFLPIESFASPLETLMQLAHFSELEQLLHPQGFVRAKGQMIIDGNKEKKHWSVKTDLEALVTDCEIQGISYQVDHCLCSWYYTPGHQTPGHHTPASNQFRICLNDGTYSLFGKEMSFKNIVLSSLNQTFSIQCEHLFLNQWLPIELKTDSKHLHQGTLNIDDRMSHTLQCQWSLEPKGKEYQIHVIQGVFHDIHFDLNKGSQPYSLIGTVSGTLDTIYPFLTNADWQQCLHYFQTPSPIQLEGAWSYLDPEQISFAGNLYAKSAQIFGISADSLTSDLCLHKHKIQFRDVCITDGSGKIHIPEAVLEKLPIGWHFDLASLQGWSLKPKFFPLSSSDSSRNFTIRELSLKNCTGILNQPQSYAAKGSLSFSHGKKGSFFPFFALKGDKDSTVPSLTPTSGTVHFTIEDEKIKIIKLKDAYSDHKLIKFYLPKGTNSFIDFEGNMQISLSLQPYNVLLKMDDLLTLTIGGTVQEPNYAFQ